MMSDNGSLDSHDHEGFILINNVIKENENPNFDFLDIDSYLEVSRFVSNSVTRGMLNPVETEAAEKIAQKEIEASRSLLILDHACNNEYKESLGKQNVESSCKKSLLLDQKTKEIAGLRGELELISKLLSGYANGDIDETLDSPKNADNLHRKIFGSIGSLSSIWDTNGKHIEALRHLSYEELINHFKNEMLQMKREHDSTIQEMTEEYFSIRRRCLNLENPGSFSCLKKDKEFDMLRKKILDIISRLDNVLSDDEKSVFEVDSLLLENRQLQVSLLEANQKISQLSQVEANHRKLIRKLESDAEDSHVETSIFDDVYESFVGEFVNQIHCAKQETYSCVDSLVNELKVVSARAAEKTEGYEMELELARKNMKVTENEKAKSELKLSSTEAEQKRLKHQFVSTFLSLAEWSQGFNNLECVLAEKMKKTNSRLESMQSQLSDLLDEVDELKARESMYKQHMEKKTGLLGEEIESLLDLLAKIYIALDHYSLILKHYPGIIEILKLVRRELRGESKRLSVFRPSLI